MRSTVSFKNPEVGIVLKYGDDDVLRILYLIGWSTEKAREELI